MTHKPENRPSVNQLTAPLVDALVDDADLLRLGVSTMDNGTRIIDAGIEARGGLEAGRLIAEICMGGLGSVSLRASSSFKRWAWNLDVYSTEPVLACLGSQYAGWALSHGEGKNAFFGLGSGPGRGQQGGPVQGTRLSRQRRQRLPGDGGRPAAAGRAGG